MAEGMEDETKRGEKKIFVPSPKKNQLGPDVAHASEWHGRLRGPAIKAP